MDDGDQDSDEHDWDEVARVLDESEGCFAVMPEKETAKPKRSSDLPHPSKRTREQRLFAVHLMRERR